MTIEEKIDIDKKLMSKLIDLGFKYREFGIEISCSFHFYCDDLKSELFEEAYVSVRCKKTNTNKIIQNRNYSKKSQKMVIESTIEACENMKNNIETNKKEMIKKLKNEIKKLEK